MKVKVTTKIATVTLSSLLASCLMGQNSFAKSLDVKSLNREIEMQSMREAEEGKSSSAKHNTWYAKDSWLNSLTEEELKKMFTLEVPDKTVEFSEPETHDKSSSLPVKWDWREVNGRNWISPIKNQGVCGSCVAFAAVGTLETQINVSSVNPLLNIQLSPQHLFSCGGGKCDYGWRPESAAKFLKNTGVVDEACMPYLSGAQGADQSCNSKCTDSDSRTIRISDFDRPTWFFRNREKVKKALLKGPLVTTMKVYEDFLSYSHGVYKHVKGPALGGHAISLVGYDDEKGAFLIRNSWGESWGDKGFAYMDYEDISGIGHQTWLYEVPKNSKYLTIDYPKNYDVVAKTVILKMNSTLNSVVTSGSSSASNSGSGTSINPGTNNEAIHYQYSVKSAQAAVGSRNAAALNLVTNNKSELSFDSTMLKDGKYEIQLSAMDNTGKEIVKSRPHIFYVLNHEPEVQISLSLRDKQNVTELRGRVELQILAKTNSVPLNEIEFHFKDEEGKEQIRTTKSQLDVMNITWGTGQLKNGKYQLWLVGKVVGENFKYEYKSEVLEVSLKN